MIVTDNRTRHLVRLADCRAGDVIDICGEPAVVTVDGNAVVLKDGTYADRDYDDMVEKIDAEVVVK